MITVEIQSSKETQQAIERLANKLRNPSQALEAVGAELDSMAQHAFATKSSPDGKAWKPLALSTIQARARRNSGGSMFTPKTGKVSARYKKADAAARSRAGILYDTGYMANSLTWRVVGGRLEMRISSHHGAAHAHQFGGKTGRGRKVVLPARPWWPVEENNGRVELTSTGERAIREMIQDFLLKD